MARASAGALATVRRNSIRRLLGLVAALVEGVSVELLAEVLEAPGAGLVVLANSKRLVAAAVLKVERLGASLGSLGLRAVSTGLEGAKLGLEVSYDCRVVELLDELRGGQLETPCGDLRRPAGALSLGRQLDLRVDRLHLCDHVL